jgi:hypothetical protein
MHMSVGEAWSKQQLRAAAWIWQYAEREYGIPPHTARVGKGNPTPVWRKGHISHKDQATAAGFNDRVDPGPGSTRRMSGIAWRTSSARATSRAPDVVGSGVL